MTLELDQGFSAVQENWILLLQIGGQTGLKIMHLICDYNKG